MKILYKSALLTYHARNALLKAENRLDAYLLSVARQQNWIRKGGRGNCPAVESLGCVEAWFKVAAHIRQGAREQQQATYPSLMQFSLLLLPEKTGSFVLERFTFSPNFSLLAPLSTSFVQFSATSAFLRQFGCWLTQKLTLQAKTLIIHFFGSPKLE